MTTNHHSSISNSSNGSSDQKRTPESPRRHLSLRETSAATPPPPPTRGFLSLRGAESEPKPPRRFSFRSLWGNHHKKQHNDSSTRHRRRASWAHPEKPSTLSLRKKDSLSSSPSAGTSRSSSNSSSILHEKPTAPECIGTCFHQTWNESRRDPEAISQDVRAFCESPGLQEFCTRAGLIEPTFEWSSHMCPRRGLLHFRKNELYTQFWEACQAQPDSHMAVVFHGTSEPNIPRVLKCGLDPKYRRTQAFGKGDYFSKEAGLATTYCHGGHKMVVYLVLLPKDKDPKWSQRDRDIVVVDHVEHELPIGVLTYQDVDHDAVQASQQVRVQQAFYKNRAVEKERLLAQQQQQHDKESAKQLEREVHEAWQHYHEMREDELRNIHLSRYVDSAALVVK